MSEMAVSAIRGPILGTASLLDLDPELFDALDAPARAAARRHAVVRVARLEPGSWDPAALTESATRPFAALASGGVLISEVLLGASVAADLIGPGEIIDVGAVDADFLPAARRWSAAEPVTLAILDAHLLPVMRAWPSVAAALTTRATARARRLEIQRAISQLPQIEERLIAFFGHLAERFGRVTADGVVVPVALTHQMLGRLVGARRPTVSLALKELTESGTLVRRGDGAWLLAHRALGPLAADVDARPAPRAADAVTVPLPPQPAPVQPQVTIGDLRSLTVRCEALKQLSTDLHQRSEQTILETIATRESVQAARRQRSRAA